MLKRTVVTFVRLQQELVRVLSVTSPRAPPSSYAFKNNKGFKMSDKTMRFLARLVTNRQSDFNGD